MRPQKGRYTHMEAFCLMRYSNDDGSEAEVLWNSRDGVTPLTITSRSGVRISHVRWEEDDCNPSYRPRPGQRIFVDATLELITLDLQRYVDRIWDDAQYPASRHWETKEDAFAALQVSWLRDGSPWVVVWPMVEDGSK